MEADAAFVRADGVVELHAVADIVLHFTFVVNPCDAEGYDAVGFDHALDNFVTLEFGMLVVDILNTHQDFPNGLQIFFLARMFGLKIGHDLIDIHNDVLVEACIVPAALAVRLCTGDRFGC